MRHILRASLFVILLYCLCNHTDFYSMDLLPTIRVYCKGIRKAEVLVNDMNMLELFDYVDPKQLIWFNIINQKIKEYNALFNFRDASYLCYEVTNGLSTAIEEHIKGYAINVSPDRWYLKKLIPDYKKQIIPKVQHKKTLL